MSDPVYFCSLSLREKRELIDSIDTILIDCDGVLWNSDGIIADSPTTINTLITALGKQVFFVTNNSTKTKVEFHRKCLQYGFQISEDSICNTATLAAKYLKSVLPTSTSSSVFVVGSTALREELNLLGIESFGYGKDELPGTSVLENIAKFPLEIRSNVAAVLVGFDENINYVKMLKAATYLRRDKSCLFVATNNDQTFPSPSKNSEYTMPGAGAILAGIQVASGREPFIVGKPSTYLAGILSQEYRVNASRTLFIGDRCNTDILMGNKCCFKTLLVLSGVHSLEDVATYQSSMQEDDQLSVPQYYTDNISDLLCTE